MSSSPSLSSSPSSSPQMMDGNSIVAECLKRLGISTVFGVVGIPVVEMGRRIQASGVKFLGFRNEQSASYAASAAGYMSHNKPGVCLSVAGPGIVHCLAGLSNSWANGWPMLLISGCYDTHEEHTGSFQEMDHMSLVAPYVKFKARPDSLSRIPYLINKAVRVSLSGRPGPVFIDLPGNLLSSQIDVSKVVWMGSGPVEAPLSIALPSKFKQAVDLLRGAKSPLLIVGKGAAYSRAEDTLRRFVDLTRIPFLPTPMGKGVIPDDHPLNISAARSLALKHADVIILAGARLNWILHFGKYPRFNRDVKFIQMDISGEEMGEAQGVSLLGDCNASALHLTELWEGDNLGALVEESGPWLQKLKKKASENLAVNKALEIKQELPMGYYQALSQVRDLLPRDTVLVTEGANTMDIARTVLPSFYPRQRLDAGTLATMGVGLGYCIAAKALNTGKKVVGVLGDSAFGFSAMEIETACRYKLPIVIVIINNNGIYEGLNELPSDPSSIPVTSLSTECRYDLMAEALGGKGYLVRTPLELRSALTESLSYPIPCLINVLINPVAAKKPQENSFISRSKL